MKARALISQLVKRRPLREPSSKSGVSQVMGGWECVTGDLF